MLPGKTTDTIAAIATPSGPGGVGIVRVSGPGALTLLGRVFQPKKAHNHFASHQLYFGTIRTAEGRPLDEALAVFMQGPHSYTGEDVVEFQCHAAPVVLQELVERLCSLGARPAEPGEFTKRAFLAGRIDLAQAEAVLDLVSARTRAGAELATAQLQGALGREVAQLRAALLELLAQLEVAIDFPDEDAELFDRESASQLLQERVLAPLSALLADAEHGRLYREGARVVLVGLPNAGKSSLMNALLQEDRALVTAIPGTTRDSIEESFNLAGVPVRLVDTAGIRFDCEDPVEALGVERARNMMERSDCLLFLLDGQAGLNDAARRLYGSLPGAGTKRWVLALNKCDLLSPEEAERAGGTAAELAGLAPGEVVRISAKTGQGLEELRQALLRAISPAESRLGVSGALPRFAPNRRHRLALNRAESACRYCLETLAAGLPLDLLGVDAQAIMDAIAELSGESSPDEVLDAVFSQFCIGK